MEILTWRTLNHDHDKFGKSTTRFSQTFIKTLIILKVNIIGENFVCQFYLTLTFIAAILLTDQL